LKPEEEKGFQGQERERRENRRKRTSIDAERASEERRREIGRSSTDALLGAFFSSHALSLSLSLLLSSAFFG